LRDEDHPPPPDDDAPPWCLFLPPPELGMSIGKSRQTKGFRTARQLLMIPK
jgi:hypothetical protein